MAGSLPVPERLEARVRGLVQGVGFRWFVVHEATRLGLVGWVANGPDGAVSVVAEGPPEALDVFAAALAEGPSGAHVRGVDVRRSPASGHYSRFEVRAGEHGGD